METVDLDKTQEYRDVAQTLVQNIFNANIQTITIQGPGAYSSMEYTKYDRALLLSLGFRLNDKAKKTKVQKTEYGEKDF